MMSPADWEVFLSHSSDEDCNHQVNLIYNGDPSHPFFEVLQQRYYNCINDVYLFPSMERVGKPLQSWAVARYTWIEEIKNADRIVLLLTDRLTAAEDLCRMRVKKACREAGKVVTQIAIDPITLVKMENFSDCDAFCFIGCPTRARRLIQQSKEFRRKVFVPHELLVSAPHCDRAHRPILPSLRLRMAIGRGRPISI